VIARDRRRAGVALFCWLAGACDGATGLLLVASPRVALDLMRVAPAPAEPIYLRFVGVFVGGVGFAYLYPWVLARSRRWLRIVTVLELTTGLRLAVGIFVVASVAAGALVPAWLVVAVTDLGVAAAQVFLLGRRVAGEET
jgi:hypothetical protein